MRKWAFLSLGSWEDWRVKIWRLSWVQWSQQSSGCEGHYKSYRTPTASKCFWFSHISLSLIAPYAFRNQGPGKIFQQKEKREHTQLPDLPVNRSLWKEGCFCLRIQSYVLRVTSSYPCFEWAAKASRLFEKALIYAALQKQRRAHKALDAKCLLSRLYISSPEEQHTFVKEHIGSAQEPEAKTQVSFVPSNQPAHLQASLPLALLYELSQKTGNTFTTWWGAILENNPPAQPQTPLLTYSLMSFDFTAL